MARVTLLNCAVNICCCMSKVAQVLKERLCFSCSYLKYLLTTDLYTAVAGWGLLLRKFLPQGLQLLHKVSLIFGHSQALCLLR